MTTHYEKIQALGNRMASNLETMGVSASFSDGGLTLADKILQIQHFTDGLLLWANKDIIQTGETVTFNALLLDDKKGVSGETIVFYDSNSVPISYDTSGIHTINKNLGKSFMVHYEGDTELQFYDESNTGYSLVYKANKSLEITSSGSSQITWNNVEWVKMVNGVLSDNNGNSFDLSSLVTNVILMHLVGTGSVYFDVVGVGVTDSNGVATVGYTGKGAGVLNIKAVHGIIQSEEYIVIDGLFADTDGTADWYAYNGLTKNGTVLSTTQTGRCYANSSSSVNRFVSTANDFCIEFDIVSATGDESKLVLTKSTNVVQNIPVSSRVTSNNHFKIVFNSTTNQIQVTVDDTVYNPFSASNLANANVGIYFELTNTATLTYANFVVYPI